VGTTGARRAGHRQRRPPRQGEAHAREQRARRRRRRAGRRPRERCAAQRRR
jgi:hypothetical protein